MAPLFQGQSNSQRKQTGEINLGYRYIRQTILDQALIPPLFREEILDQNVIKDSLCDEVGSQMIRARRTAELAGESNSRIGGREEQQKKTQNFILHAKYYTSILTAITTDQSF
jgi:hypothetical protein